MNKGISKSIVTTIAYYDVLDYPLTSFEIWKYLLNESLQPVSMEAVKKVLETESVRRYVSHSHGMYFLSGRRMLVKRRLRRGKLSIAKQKGVHNLVFWLRFVPFIRMVALTGSLAMKNSETSGDWDLLIVLRSGHIWTGRALLTGLLQIFGKRRHGEDVADRACLNYWITTDSLEIITKDLFSSNEYFFITPLFGFTEFQKFQEKNQWIRRFRPQFQVVRSAHLFCMKDFWLPKLTRDIGEILLSDRALERKLSVLQKKKIAANPKTKLTGSLIEATDKALIFLPKPQGPKVFEKFKQRLSDLEALA
ncbi:MAG: hypothetical protein PHT88_04085 [Candidatus Moranbacteria bacterium]|nr:hypothetical protein [Candidatus Moranbacteria bacterium]